MSLLDGNYIESAHSFETAWELVLQALVGSSQPGFDWQVDADKTAKRIVATMDFGSAFQAKRHLTLELVFSQIGEALRLEMQYAIAPMVNIGQSEKLLQKARDSIGKALTAGQELYQVGVIAANKEEPLEAESERQGNDRLLQGIEIVLLLNVVLVLIFSMTTKSLQSAMSTVLMLQFFWIPVGVFVRNSTKVRLLAFVLLAVCPSAATADTSNKPLPGMAQLAVRDSIFVVNGQDNSLTVIDPTRNSIFATIALPMVSYPHHISLSPDRSKLALAAPGVDLSLGHDGTSISHGKMSMGKNMQTDKNMAMKESSVLVLDSRTGATLIERKFSDMNHNAIFSPDSKEIWTGQMGSPGAVLVLDAKTLKVLKSIAVGNRPAEVTFTIDGKNAFVANGQSNTVSVIDIRTKRLTKTIPVGKQPVGAWQGKDGIMYVDNEIGKSVTAIDAKTLTVKRLYNLGFTPGMAATASNGELWVSDSDNGKVAFYKPNSIVKLGDVATGAGAHAIVFSGDSKTGYVSNQNANTVTVIDVKSHKVKTNIAVGKKPNGMVWRSK